MTTGLDAALATALQPYPAAALAAATAGLVERYRSPRPAEVGAPIVGDELRAAAYAAYRMPATAAVLRRILTELAEDIGAARVLDLGGGTGSGAWAAVEAFGADCRVTVLDAAPAALALGRRIAAADPAVAAAVEFRRGELEAGGWHTDPAFEPADLAIVSYVLSELDDSLQEAAVASAARAATTVLVAEPGTPDGYRRILSARERLIAMGWTLLGPCPHALNCPLGQGDWCHFGTRLARSALHRRSKGADLSYEDEKYAWVAATREPRDASRDAGAVGSRVLRRPVIRKGLVDLQVCRPDGTAGGLVISKRQGAAYRAARDLRWGDRWPGRPGSGEGAGESQTMP